MFVTDGDGRSLLLRNMAVIGEEQLHHLGRWDKLVVVRDGLPAGDVADAANRRAAQFAPPLSQRRGRFVDYPARGVTVAADVMIWASLVTVR